MVVGERTKIRLRGLSFRQRPEHEVAPEQLARIDICWSISTGLSLVDPMLGIAFQGRHLLLALRAGTPIRIARALAMEGAHVARLGRWGRGRSERVFRAAEAVSRQAEDPYTLALLELSRGVGALLLGDWSASRAHCEGAERILRDRCTGALWELDTGQIFHTWACFYGGRIPTIARRVPELLRSAQERGDRYLATGMRTGPPNVMWLANDAPDTARDEIDEAMRQWSKQGFHLQHLWELVARVHIDLYCGHGAAAWERMGRAWPGLRSSFLLTVQLPRVQARYMRACSALMVAAQQPRHRVSMITRARSDARKLALERTFWSDPLADLVYGCAAAVEGKHDAALGYTDRAAVRFDTAGMPLHAAAARRRRGQLLAGDNGRALIEATEHATQQRGIRRADRWTDMLAPPVGG